MSTWTPCEPQSQVSPSCKGHGPSCARGASGCPSGWISSWKRCYTLAGAAQGGAKPPSLEVSEESLDVALWAGDKVGITHRLDLVLEVFSSLNNSVILLNLQDDQNHDQPHFLYSGVWLLVWLFQSPKCCRSCCPQQEEAAGCVCCVMPHSRVALLSQHPSVHNQPQVCCLAEELSQSKGAQHVPCVSKAAPVLHWQHCISLMSPELSDPSGIEDNYKYCRERLCCLYLPAALSPAQYSCAVFPLVTQPNQSLLQVCFSSSVGFF